MSWRVIAALVFVWIAGITLGIFCEQAAMTSDQASKLDILASHAIFKYNTSGILTKVPVPNTEYFRTLWECLTWDFAFWPTDSPWQLLRFILLVPITVGIVYGLLSQLLTSMTQGKFA